MEHINLEIEEALKSDVSSQYGALIIYRNKILAKAHNVYKTFTTMNRSSIL